MLEIVRVKMDNKVLAVKLPLEGRLAGEFRQGSYMVWTRHRGGGYILRPHNLEVKKHGRVKGGKSGEVKSR